MNNRVRILGLLLGSALATSAAPAVAEDLPIRA